MRKYEESDLLCLLRKVLLGALKLEFTMGNSSVSLSFALALGISADTFGVCLSVNRFLYYIVHFEGQFVGVS